VLRLGAAEQSIKLQHTKRPYQRLCLPLCVYSVLTGISWKYDNCCFCDTSIKCQLLSL